MAEPDVEVDVSDLSAWAESRCDGFEMVALVLQPVDARKLVDRLCKELGYWPKRPGPVIDVFIEPPRERVVYVPVIDPRGGGMRA